MFSGKEQGNDAVGSLANIEVASRKRDFTKKLHVLGRDGSPRHRLRKSFTPSCRQQQTFQYTQLEISIAGNWRLG